MPMQLSKHFLVTIPTKPYLKKYLLTKYGDPLLFTREHFFGMVVMAMAEHRGIYEKHNEEISFRRFDKFTTPIQIRFPRWILERSDYGSTIKRANIIMINKLFEERFDEDLCFFSAVMQAAGLELKEAREEFCRLHNIEIEIDITDEALKKKEYRHRNNEEKKFYAQLSSEKLPKLEQLTLYPIW